MSRRGFSSPHVRSSRYLAMNLPIFLSDVMPAILALDSRRATLVCFRTCRATRNRSCPRLSWPGCGSTILTCYPRSRLIRVRRAATDRILFCWRNLKIASVAEFRAQKATDDRRLLLLAVLFDDHRRSSSSSRNTFVAQWE